MKKFIKLLACIGVCELVGIAGTPFTIAAIPSWYQFLNKPFFSPPNWLFGPMWTILYLLMGISLYLVWIKKNNKKALQYFFMQLFLNFLWSILFFGLRSPLLGLIDILLLLIFILLTMQQLYKLSKLSFYLFIPYLFWVSFATILNTAIVLLN